MNSQLWLRTGLTSAAAVVPAVVSVSKSALAASCAAAPLVLSAPEGKTEYIPLQGLKYVQHLGMADGPAPSGVGYVYASYPDGMPMYHDFEERAAVSANQGIDASGLLALAPLYLFALGMAGFGIFGFLRGRGKAKAARSEESTPVPVVQDNGPETVAATPRAKAPRFGVKIGGESIPGNSEPPPAGDGRPRLGGRTIY